MKKYLMIGFAAVAFAACSNHDFETTTQADIDKAKYDQAFISYIGGRPAANQNWGFGPSTRAFTRGHDANANEWANNKDNDNTGHGGWIVPDELSEGQKLRIKAYFQNNTNLSYQDPELTNFFVQQVYKGGSSPKQGGSAEVYYAANDPNHTNPIGSNNMNLLSASQDDWGNADHINNFNHGSYGIGDWQSAEWTEGYVNVLNNGSDILAGKTSYHQDQIMLMVGAKTDFFSYHNSACSKTVKNKMVLVSADDIDTWCEANNIGGQKVKDKWNRSFMGFDFDMYSLDEATYKENGVARRFTPAEDSPRGVTSYVTYDDGATFQEISNTDAIWTDFKYDNKEVHYLISNTNFYCGETITVSTDDLYKVYQVWNETNKNWEYKAHGLNMKKINDLLKDGYLPVRNSSMQTWAKFAPGCDGYYTDWIVTLTDADHPYRETPSDFDLRIIAEDLSATQASDFDFNDVVIDVKYSATKAQIVLVAAGGTLPLRVGSTNGIGGVEVHEAMLGADNAKNGNDYKMINTGYPTPKGINNVSIKDITDDINMAIPDAATANNLRIEVYKNGSWQLLTANVGEPACKLAVDPDYVILGERESIKDRYPNFVEWATTNNLSEWWNITE